MNDRDPDQDIIDEIERQIAEGTDLDGLIPIKGRVSKNARAVFSVRLSKEEYEAISKAAKTKDSNVSDFIRDAAMDAALLAEQAESEEYGLMQVRADVATLNRKLDKALKRQAS